MFAEIYTLLKQHLHGLFGQTLNVIALCYCVGWRGAGDISGVHIGWSCLGFVCREDIYGQNASNKRVLYYLNMYWTCRSCVMMTSCQTIYHRRIIFISRLFPLKFRVGRFYISALDFLITVLAYVALLELTSTWCYRPALGKNHYCTYDVVRLFMLSILIELPWYIFRYHSGFFNGTRPIQLPRNNPDINVHGANMGPTRAPSQYPKRRLFVRSRKVSRPRDWYFKLSYRFEIWQAHRQHCCRSACQITERSDNS